MKKVMLIVSVIVFSYFSASAQQSDQDTYNGPEINFEKVIHDYGTLTQGGNGGCEFKFTNTGNEPLILSNVISSCGCTVPKWPRQPILPGKSEVIKVTYDTKRLGTISKSITVLSNAKTNRVILSIKGKINKKPVGTPPEKKDISPLNK
ncbi:DUF1573 domain-containing protein [candidate division KSB1 bacterium]